MTSEQGLPIDRVDSSLETFSRREHSTYASMVDNVVANLELNPEYMRNAVINVELLLASSQVWGRLGFDHVGREASKLFRTRIFFLSPSSLSEEERAKLSPKEREEKERRALAWAQMMEVIHPIDQYGEDEDIVEPAASQFFREVRQDMRGPFPKPH